METIQNTSTTPDAPKKKNRPPKLSEAELALLPGDDTTPVKKAEPEYTNYIEFNIPVTGPFGSATEAGQVHDFAHQVDAQAKAKGIGSVISVGVSNGIFDVVLKMEAGGDAVKQSGPAAEALVKLRDYLGGAVQLKPGPAGKAASYQIRVNGTTTGSKHF
jgi:hypothetical protein